MKNNQPRIILLPKITDVRGNLSFAESQHHIPFSIKRVYWIYDVPGGEVRGGHAFKEQEEFIIALSGSFDVVIYNGKRKKKYHLNRSYFGLYVPAGLWRSMENFSTNSICLVVASTFFDQEDYIRDYNEFLNFDFSKVIKRKLTFPDLKNLSVFDKTTVNDCKLIELDKNHREKGNITVIENRDHTINFDIERIYYLYDVPGGEERGGHAHKALYQLIVAAGGSFDVVIDDGKNKRIVTLNRPYQGLYIVPGIWRELINFSSGSTCTVLASQKYDKNDYIRDYNTFLSLKS